MRMRSGSLVHLLARIVAFLLSVLIYYILSRASGKDPVALMPGVTHLRYSAASRLIYGTAAIGFPFIVAHVFDRDADLSRYTPIAIAVCACLSVYLIDGLSLQIFVEQSGKLTVRKFFRTREIDLSEVDVLVRTRSGAFNLKLHRGRNIEVLPTLIGLDWFVQFLRSRGIKAED